MEKSIFKKCHCCCSVLEVESDTWDWCDKTEPPVELPFINVSLWQDGYSRPMGWRERLRWCARVLRTGNPWADHTMLTAADAREVANFILEEIDTYAKTKEEGEKEG